MPYQWSPLEKRREQEFWSAEVKRMCGLRPRKDWIKREEMRGYTWDLTLRKLSEKSHHPISRTWDLDERTPWGPRDLWEGSSSPNPQPSYLLLRLHRTICCSLNKPCIFTFLCLYSSCSLCSYCFLSSSAILQGLLSMLPLFKPLPKLLVRIPFPLCYPNSGYHRWILVIIREFIISLSTPCLYSLDVESLLFTPLCGLYVARCHYVLREKSISQIANKEKTYWGWNWVPWASAAENLSIL